MLVSASVGLGLVTSRNKDMKLKSKTMVVLSNESYIASKVVIGGADYRTASQGIVHLSRTRGVFTKKKHLHYWRVGAGEWNSILILAGSRISLLSSGNAENCARWEVTPPNGN